MTATTTDRAAEHTATLGRQACHPRSVWSAKKLLALAAGYAALVEPWAQSSGLSLLERRYELLDRTTDFELWLVHWPTDGGLVLHDHGGIERNVLEWRLDPTNPHRHAAVTRPDQPVVVICQAGYASSLAAASLRQLGLVNATDLVGGFEAWAEAGLPVAGPSAANSSRELFYQFYGKTRSRSGSPPADYSKPMDRVGTLGQLDPVTFVDEWQQWHTAHERQLAAPHGFLAVTGIYWLTATPERFPGAPGRWSSDDEGAKVVLDDGDSLTVDDVVVNGAHRFGVIPERGGRTAYFRDAAVEVAKRCGRDILRPRHPDYHLRAEFSGVPTYAPDPRWACKGRFVAFRAPRPTTVGSVVEGLEHVYDAPGQVEFDIGGETFRLTAFNGATPGSLMVLFVDATSGTTTYAADRTVGLDAPDEHGNVVLDFNRAVNLPCAFTDFATCPLPPAENRLPIAIEAGEKIPYERLAG